jgi:gamma-glutamylcyclotransferase (GGCT)/AIG2-like uncharacterized protein YtfP
MNKKLYIAYGSNLCQDQMAIRCPTAKPIAKSWLHDYQLEFRGLSENAHATVSHAEGKSVPVVVWEISESDEKALDLYEGVKGGYYTKEYRTVEVDGEMKEALIYIMAPRNFGVPSDNYIGIIVRGYKDFNFDTNIIWNAVVEAYNKMILKEVRKA